MPVARTAAPAKKAAAPKTTSTRAKKAATGPLVFEAEFKKETAGSIHLTETGDRDTQVSGAIYLKKSALDGATPKRVRVTVEIVG